MYKKWIFVLIYIVGIVIIPLICTLLVDKKHFKKTYFKIWKDYGRDILLWPLSLTIILLFLLLC